MPLRDIFERFDFIGVHNLNLRIARMKSHIDTFIIRGGFEKKPKGWVFAKSRVSTLESLIFVTLRERLGLQPNRKCQKLVVNYPHVFKISPFSHFLEKTY